MTVKELIEELQTMPQDKEIFMSSDSEGNSYQLVDRNFGLYPYYRDGYHFEPCDPDDVLNGEYDGDDIIDVGVFLYPGYPPSDYPE